MAEIFQNPGQESKTASFYGAAASVCAHTALVFALLWTWHHPPMHLKPASASQGTTTRLALRTNGTGQRPVKKSVEVVAPHNHQLFLPNIAQILVQKSIAAAPAPTPTVAKSEQPVSSKQLADKAKQGATTDISSSGDDFYTLHIALQQYAPRPKVDLSALPGGKEGDVILDATIDAQGKIEDLKVISTLGEHIDQQVIAVVRTWVFTPATRDGTPVASVQELHFHYGPRA